MPARTNTVVRWGLAVLVGACGQPSIGTPDVTGSEASTTLDPSGAEAESTVATSTTQTTSTSGVGDESVTSGDAGETSDAATTDDPVGTTGTTSSGTTSTREDSGGDETTGGGGQPNFAEIPETCEEAEQVGSTVGCEFFAVDLDSHDLKEDGQFAIAVANVQNGDSATVTIEAKNADVWDVIAGPEIIGPLDLFTFKLPNAHTDDSELAPGLAYRVIADVPVIAYQFNPVDGATSFLSDASMLYPVPALDTVNHVVAWHSVLDNTYIFQHSYSTVVAAFDGTTVTVTPSVDTLAGAGVPAGSAGTPFDVFMNQGDVLSVANLELGESMTGTTIQSNDDHPVAVFAGQECAMIPAIACCCDHLEEQVAGVRLWGKDFIAARQPVRDEVFPESSAWQIYAAEDDTIVTLTADPGVGGLPPNDLNLQSGEVAEFYAAGPMDEPGDFQVSSNRPIAVFNYMTGAQNLINDSTGDPAAVQIPPVEQFLPRFVALIPETWENDVAVITRLEGATVTIDGIPVPDIDFDPVAMSGYEVARVPVPDGVHVFYAGGDPFGLVIVGYDLWDSYAYIAGVGTGVINPNPQ